MGRCPETPGTELRCIRGKYYLYEGKSFYDKRKKKTRKKTGAYLGMITENEGLVPSRRRQVQIDNASVAELAAKTAFTDYKGRCEVEQEIEDRP